MGSDDVAVSADFMSSSMPRHTAVPMQDAGPGSPRSALHTAASAAAIWQESSSPEPPQRSFSPTRLGAPARDCRADRAGSPRTSTRHSWKSQQQSPSHARQLVTGEDQVSLPRGDIVAMHTMHASSC